MKFIALIASAFVATTNAWWTDAPQQMNLIQAYSMEDFKLDEVFAAMDANGDGALTLKEVFSAIKAYAKEHDIALPAGWKKEVAGVFKHLDANGDKKVTMDEIKAAIFDAVDSNNDGEWSLDEIIDAFEAVAKEHGLKLKDGWKDQVKTAFNAVDTDNSGKVSPVELEAAIKKYGYPDLGELVA
jgi:Ca2+-binding EF-hand superfamily protein